MAQPLIAFAAVPGGEDPTTLGVTVVSTRSSWTSWSITVAQPDGEVTKWKGVDDTSSTTSVATTTIIANKLLGKLQSKGLKILEGARSTRGLQKNVGVCDRHIKEEEENVLVHFSAP